MNWQDEHDAELRREKKKLLDSVRRRKTFYHYGPVGLKPGTRLRAEPRRPGPGKAISKAVEGVFEQVRREKFPGMPSRIDAVFMTTEPRGWGGKGSDETWYEVRKVKGKAAGVIGGIEVWSYAMTEFMPHSISRRIKDDGSNVRDVLRKRLSDPDAIRSLRDSAKYYWSGGNEHYMAEPLGIEVIGQGVFEIVGPVKRKNPDEDLRELERRAAGRDPQAERALVRRLTAAGVIPKAVDEVLLPLRLLVPGYVARHRRGRFVGIERVDDVVRMFFARDAVEFLEKGERIFQDLLPVARDRAQFISLEVRVTPGVWDIVSTEPVRPREGAPWENTLFIFGVDDPDAFLWAVREAWPEVLRKTGHLPDPG